MTATILKWVFLSLTALVLYVAFRTALMKSEVEYPMQQRSLEKNFPISIHEALAEAIRFPTISYDAHSGKALNQTAFEGLRKFLFKRKCILLWRIMKYFY